MRPPVWQRALPWLPAVLSWAVACALAAWWLRADRTPFPWDMAGHARDAFDIWHELTHLRLDRIYRQSDYYPPLFALLAAPLTLFSSAPAAYCVANWAALAGAMAATGLAARQIGSRAAAVAAAALLPAFVMLAWMLRQPMLDLVLTATVAWTLALLMSTPELRSPRQAGWIGLSIAAGLLAKWPYLFFMGLPLAAWGLRQLARQRRGEGVERPWRHVLWLTLPALLLAGPWYLRALPEIAGKLGAQLGGEIAAREGDPAVFTLASLLTYPRWTFEFYTRLPLALLLGAGLAGLALRLWRGRTPLAQATNHDPARRHAWRMLALTGASGFVILTLIANKDPRYMMPLVPLLAIVAVQWIDALPEWRRGWGVTAVLALALAMPAWNFTRHAMPDRRAMELDLLAEWIIEQRGDRRRGMQVLVVPNDWLLNAAALNYELHRRDRRSRARRPRGELDAEGLRRVDLILIAEPSEPNTGIAPRVAEQTAQVRTLPGWHARRSFERGDGKRLVLYARDAEGEE